MSTLHKQGGPHKHILQWKDSSGSHSERVAHTLTCESATLGGKACCDIA